MISLFFIGLLLLISLWNLYYAKHWAANLVVSLDFLQKCAYTGERVEMTEQIENRKKMMLPILEVGFHMDKNLSFYDCENTSVSDFTYKRDIFALLGRQRVIRKLSLDCRKRGYYRIDKSYLTTFSMLHRRRLSIECPASTELYVYAARTDVSDILVACERLMGSLQCAKRLYEDPFAFSSIREYTVTDPMNTINWKASARTGELMVNTFESTLTEKVMIYLDMEDSGILKYEHLTEESVSVAASLTQKLIGRGMEVGLCVNNQTSFTYVEPSTGRKHLTDIERTLSCCKSEGNVLPFTTLLAPKTDESTHSIQTDDETPAFPAPPEDAIVIFISKNALQNKAAIEQFAGGSQQAVWVIPYTRGETCNITKSNNIHICKREVSAI
ncbi:MAG: DUF58 domain-containing protein [Lachnospiraceae bacterium]|nr:DUF58 domain-containing protein [Lachnospiraceae bacterium]